MSEPATDEPTPTKKRSKLPLIIGTVVALLGGGAGFYAVYSGMLFSSETHAEEETAPPKSLPDIAFVAIDPILVSLPAGASSNHLRFRAQLEVPSEYQTDVENILPRIVDVLNTYLRAIRAEDLEAPAALLTLRAQMLRRVQIVAGQGRIRDLLVMEFVLN